MYSFIWRMAGRVETHLSSYYYRGSSKLAASGVAVTVSVAGAGSGSVKRFLGLQLCRVNCNLSFQKLRTVGLRGMHSTPQDVELDGMQVKILPALQDNYMYLIIDLKTREAAVVDPVDPDLVFRVLKAEDITLTKILTTHHHWDHSGGNDRLVKLLHGEEIEVLGGDDRIGSLTFKVRQGDLLNIGLLNVRVLATPCHTSGHVCYYVMQQDKKGETAVFTGDTLFQGGCGRFFEGTAEQMYTNLYEKIGELPDATKVFCGHEYTLQNLYYARHVEKDNPVIQDRIEWAKIRRSTEDPTVPSTIGEEKTWNPFMRVHDEAVQLHANCKDPIATMAALRKEKDSFKG